MSIQNLHSHLPRTSVGVAVKSRRVVADPPMEEVRSAHYKQLLRPFLALPLAFRGLSEAGQQPGFFRGIADANAAGYAQVGCWLRSSWGLVHVSLRTCSWAKGAGALNCGCVHVVTRWSVAGGVQFRFQGCSLGL